MAEAVELGVEQAVALVVAHALPTAEEERSTILPQCTVLGQVVTRRKVSKRMMFLSLRPSADGAYLVDEGAQKGYGCAPRHSRPRTLV